MPWNSQGGGNGPWGSHKGPKRYSSGGGQPPDFDEIIRKSQDRFRQFFPKGWGGFSVFIAAFGVLVVLWMSTGIYNVTEGEQAVVLRFGKWIQTTGPGLRYHLPYPIETVIKRRVDKINRINSGTDPLEFSKVSFGGKVLRAVEDQPLMLTGDENIVDGNFTVLWFIKDLGQYLFKARSPDETVKIAAESIIREIIAQTPIADILTKGRGDINEKARVQLQKLVDEYQLGIQIQELLLQKVDPPASVVESFRDVQRAVTDQERMVNEAQAYHNDLIPRAKGDAIKFVQQAKGQQAVIVARAEGESARFLAVLKEYRLAPEVTRRRMYLETMQKIFGRTGMVLIDSNAKGAQGVVPYLPLTELRQKNKALGAADSTSAEGLK
ncbi:MAG: FtsH protease activity modulator HflK [Pseudomonadota bacterium]